MRVRKKRSYRWLPFFIIGAVLLTSYWSVDRQLRRAMSEMVTYRAGIMAMEMMTRSVEEGLAGEGALISVMTGTDGAVTSVQTDVREVAKVKTAILGDLLQRLSSAGEQELAMPLGTLFSSEWLSGLGPAVTFRFLPEGAVNARTVSRFTSAGVNQTCHRVVLTLETTIGAITSFGSVSVTVPAEFTLAETIIVGEAPQNYTEVITEDRELLGEINDYKAQ